MTPFVFGSWRGLFVALVSCLALVSCGGDASLPYDRSTSTITNTDTTTDGGVPVTLDYPYFADTREAPKNDLSWSRCDLLTENGVAENAAECATVEVPARRSVEGTKTVRLSVKRYRPVRSPRGQFWLINGGPGGSSAALESSIDLFTAVGQELEIYFLDHRGTGRSDQLSCPEQEASGSTASTTIIGDEWGECAKTLTQSWGDDLAGFNVTEAATDLGELIERTRHADESVYLYSVSYGTYLAQRYLQIYPNQATGVVLDSICSPGACQLLLDYDRAFDQTARTLLSMCGNDASCRQELGNDPFERLTALSSNLGNGHCAELGWTKKTLRQVLGVLTMYIGLRDYIPAVIKRLDRCTDNDRSSLRGFQNVLASMNTEDPTSSQALSINIALSELSERPLPSAQDVHDNVESLYAAVDTGPRMAGAIDVWPTYALDDFYGAFATTNVPLLMLNGTLDPQTPLAVATPTGEHFTGEFQRFITVPNAAHTTLTQAPIDAEYHSCGAELIRQFLSDPQGTLDESCLDFVLPPDFAGDTEISQLLFGTETPFADEPPKAAARVTQPLERQLKALLKRRNGGLVQPTPLRAAP